MEKFCSKCSHCKRCAHAKYQDGGVLCCGVATEEADPPFDVIRMCMFKTDKEHVKYTMYQWAPDEALMLMELLANALRKHQLEWGPYREFRLLEGPTG